ncbi:MAG: flagellar export protein FliJ [Deltaproteobacteria bacterium]|nr:flagellar export protein FliJ [Deltaproteobacteria bacterium]
MYKFSLKAVLNHRRFIEEKLQKELGQIKEILGNERKRLSDLIRARRKISKELQEKQREIITISEALLHVRFIEQLSRREDLQKKQVLSAEKKVEQKREDLIEAMKNRKVLEKLKEKGWETYKHNMMKKEQEFMNEMAAVRFRHTSSE